MAIKKQSVRESVRTPTQAVVMFLFLMITVFSYKENNNTRTKNASIKNLNIEANPVDEKTINAELKSVFFPIYRLVKYPDPMFELVSNRYRKKNTLRRQP